ncbi:mechanosensitive ion channel family protein [Lignipirellula cremea]|uniref:Small-conductance mechanosensitive channel n=1 Tax=Lignipirellula cremea TaxID=2528010 RepID=A0A518DRG0_9BACT|nr:mechanosensitive ion channel family protein [Lignipirellula cremea]QDU94419.1 Small-conductance mechanosensitive channel [Lignipirellula cremea]
MFCGQSGVVSRFRFCIPARLIGLLLLLLVVGVAKGQPAVPPTEPPAEEETPLAPDAPAPAAPDKVDVNPVADDTDIASRLTRILNATGWFREPQVEVDEGVVFLQGGVDLQQHKEWAGQLAANTQDVVAVVNKLKVTEKSMWDLAPAWGELSELGANAVRNSPLLIVGLVLLAVTWWLTQLSVYGASHLFRRRFKSQLLADVAARAIAVPVFLLGLYLVLRVTGLTRLAMTVVGSTGVIALVIGFAFRDIAENFLASILISIQKPFARDDLIEVAGYKGYVQSVNMRSALLMTLEGNHVQIPNATVYKETIVNYSASPHTRFDFVAGIGYDDSVSQAQEIAMAVLKEHPAIVDEPEPLVLVESLGASTVNLRIYFWVDIGRFSSLKVRSAIIRLTKRAFDQAGISMPDEAREVVFPAGVPVRMIPADGPAAAAPDRIDTQSSTGGDDSSPVVPAHRDSAASEAEGEGDLGSEANAIQQQARQARAPEDGDDLLE